METTELLGGDELWQDGRLIPTISGERRNVGMRTMRREKYVLRFSKTKRAIDTCGKSRVDITHDNSILRLCHFHLKAHMQQVIQPSHVSGAGTNKDPVPPTAPPSGDSASSSWNVPLDTSVGSDMDVGVNMDQLRWRPAPDKSPKQRPLGSGTLRNTWWEGMIPVGHASE